MKRVFISMTTKSWWHALAAVALCVTGVLFAALSFAGPASVSKTINNRGTRSSKEPSTPTATPGWSLITSPNKVPNSLKAITCVSTFDCWAVGNWINTSTGVVQPVTEHWRGYIWSIAASASATTTNSNKGRLEGVACASSSMCWAVGEYQNDSGIKQSLIERWNGATWTIVPANTSNTVPNFLAKVTCSSVSDCWAVGNYDGGAIRTLVEHWNGTAWSVVPSPNSSGGQDNSLTGITCMSATSCWSVGSFANANPNAQTLIEHWNGSTWSIVSSPNTNLIDNDVLIEVRCQSTADCWAIGNFEHDGGSRPLSEHWNGSTWSIAAMPDVSTESYLYGIECPGGCFAIGYAKTTIGSEALLLDWDNQRWRIFSATNVGGPATAQTNAFSAVTCPNLRECWAVGYYDNAGTKQTLISYWDGNAWSIVTSPNTSPAQNNVLTGIACSAYECLASGTFQNDAGFLQTLTERWDGVSWLIVNSPNATATGDNKLAGIACAGGPPFFAVGSYVNGNGFSQTLILSWDGISWSIVSSPNNSSLQDHFLNGVTCYSQTECWAVGNYNASTASQVLIEKWNGASWSAFGSANTSPVQDNTLTGISCPGPSQCFAVGNYDAAGVSRTLIERWNGGSPSIVSSPNSDSSRPNELLGIYCYWALECWAVGNFVSSTGERHALIEQWDGTGWTIAPTNNPTTIDDFLFGAACPATGLCWTVGSRYDPGTAIYQTLVNRLAATTPSLESLSSRLSHGVTGTFDTDIPQLFVRRPEPRSGGPGNEFTLLLNFPNALVSVASVTATGSGQIVSSGIGPVPNQYIVHVSGVTNASSMVLTLHSVLDVENNSGDVSGTFNVLLGDTNADHRVDSSDVSQTKSALGQPVDYTNFREDLNVDGSINSADISLVKSRSGTALP